VPVWRRPKRDPLAAERDAHNAAIDARKAEKRERQAARRAQTGSVALEMAVLAFVVVAALLVAAWVGRA
jgi:Flp pilus assembly protein TadG